MKFALTEYIIAVFELLEAELAAFKKGLIGIIIAAVLVVLAGFLALVAFGFLAWGIYAAYLTILATHWAAFATAGTLSAPFFFIIALLSWRR